MGIPLGEIIYEIAGGIPGGKQFKAVQLGGPSGGCIPRQHLNVPVDYESVQELGAIMGSGGLIVMDEDSCMVDMARFFLEFTQEESCGKCPPCRVGTKRMLEIVTRICNGEGEEGDIEKLSRIWARPSRTPRSAASARRPPTRCSAPSATSARSTRPTSRTTTAKPASARACSSAKCTNACPAAVNVPGFVSLIGEKRFDEALRLHRERNPLASICGRVCFHPCESKCQRGGLDEPVAIRSLKRFMTEQETEAQLPEVRENAENAGKKIAVIGGGPAGLSCAYFLARLGYKPTIFEKEPSAGGMLVQAIPAYRLPARRAGPRDQHDRSHGRDHRDRQGAGQATSRSPGLRDQGYDAAFLGVGAPEGIRHGHPRRGGPRSELKRLTFLREYNVNGTAEVGKQVAVVGGGNSAIDAARTALRLGAEHVNILYRRQREQMPAWAEEILAADEEGITLLPLTAPKEIIARRRRQGDRRPLPEDGLGDYDQSGRRRPVAGPQPRLHRRVRPGDRRHRPGARRECPGRRPAGGD